MSTVWILGSGFSRPLGGPLLKDLLSELSYDRLRYLYSSKKRLTEEAGDALRLVYREWSKLQQQEPDAEAFLDYLDSAGMQSGAYAHIQALLARARKTEKRQLEGIGVGPIMTAAKRQIAAECCAFLDEANVEDERWMPYRSWVGRIGADDTIITFNYDRVLEHLKSVRELVVLDSRNLEEPFRVPIVLKLHGSVDWRSHAHGSQFIAVDDPVFALGCDDIEICLATPGPTKQQMTAAFRDLWSLAEKALESADHVVFVGYRFPPTDAAARQTLLEALSRNTQTNCLWLHIVLGPSDRDGDALRLEQLLRYTVETTGGRVDYAQQVHPVTRRGYRLTRHPLWAQDFLSIFNHQILSKI
jgi:hypothetical protein